MAAEVEVEVGAPTRLHRSFRLHRFGHLDPTLRVDDRGLVQALHTPAGPAVLEIRALDLDPSRGATRFRVRGHGPGGPAVVARAPAILGADDDPSHLIPRCEPMRRLVRSAPGLRLVRAASPLAMLLNLILQQRVAWRDAARAHLLLVRRFGTPIERGLVLPPSPATWASLPIAELAAVDVERKRADTLREVARLFGHLHRWVEGPTEDAKKKLHSIPGIGVWTVEGFAGFAMADPDALPLGDYDLPHRMSSALGGPPRSSDAEMVARLEPYRGQRWRIVRLVEESGVRLVRYAPRRGSGRPREVEP